MRFTLDKEEAAL